MKRFDKNQFKIISVYRQNGDLIAGTGWDRIEIGNMKQARDYVGNRLCKTRFGRVTVRIEQDDGEYWQFGMNLGKYRM